MLFLQKNEYVSMEALAKNDLSNNSNFKVKNLYTTLDLIPNKMR